MNVTPRLIVGLGNPGEDYVHTRHNIGFMAVDALAQHYRCGPWKKKFKSLVTGTDFLLLKPQTYMNLSGEAVGEAMRFHKLAPSEVLVFHDDLDLPAGEVRIKQGGGAGGHNGLKSLDAHIGKDYGRVRLGIGRPVTEEKGEVVTNYVLSPFAKTDKLWRDPLLELLAKEFAWMRDGKAAEYVARVKKNAGYSLRSV